MPVDVREVALSSPEYWQGIDLVVFDVDGTLYNQSRLRKLMALEMLSSAVRHRTTREIRIVSAYRRLREQLGDENLSGFETALMNRTVAATGYDLGVVTKAIFEWIDRRPLRHLGSCRFAGLGEVFEDLRRHGKQIGVWSDYPVAAKLEALGLRAHFEVCAGEQDVDALKPNPKGLLTLMKRAGASPDQTLMIGDRIDRDGMAATRANTRALIKAGKHKEGCLYFRNYRDDPFTSLRDDL